MNRFGSDFVVMSEINRWVDWQGVKIVFRLGLALLRYCQDDLVSMQLWEWLSLGSIDFRFWVENHDCTWGFCLLGTFLTWRHTVLCHDLHKCSQSTLDDGWQVKLPFEKLVHALRNFPDDALQPDVLLPLAYNIKVDFLTRLSVHVFILAKVDSYIYSLWFVRSFVILMYLTRSLDWILLIRSLFAGFQEAGGSPSRVWVHEKTSSKPREDSSQVVHLIIVTPLIAECPEYGLNRVDLMMCTSPYLSP
jgi:hypothetical protein